MVKASPDHSSRQVACAKLCDAREGRQYSVRICRGKCCSALVALLFPLALYAANFPDYPLRAANSYQHAVDQSDVVVAAEVVSDTESQKKYFHVDFTKKNYLPIFVVLNNQSSTSSLIVKPEEIGVSSGQDQTSSNGDVASGRSKAGERIELASAIAISLPGLVVANYMMEKALDVRQNILKKELRGVTLSPGQSAHGFVYIPLQELTHDVGRLTMRVRVHRPGEDKPIDIEISLQ